MLLRNLSLVAIGRIASFVATFVLVHNLVQGFGLEFYGLFSVCGQLMLFMALADLGMSLGFQNYISQLIEAPAQAAHVGRVLSACMIMLAAVALAVFLLSAVAIYLVHPSPIDLLFPNGAAVVGHERAIVMLMLAIFCVGLPLQIPQRLLMGLQRQGGIALVQGFSSLGAALLLVVWLQLVPQSLALAITLLTPVVVPAAYAAITGRQFITASSLASPSWSEGRRMLVAGLWLFTSQACSAFIFQTDIMLVSAWHGLRAAADYSLCARIIGLLTMVASVILPTLWPTIANRWARRERAWVLRCYRGLLWLIVASIPVGLLLSVEANVIIQRWTGNGAIHLDSRLQWGYAFFTITTLWSGVHATLLNAMGEVRFPGKIAMLQAVLNLGLCLVFIAQGAWVIPWVSGGVALLVNAVPLCCRVISVLRSVPHPLPRPRITDRTGPWPEDPRA